MNAAHEATNAAEREIEALVQRLGRRVAEEIMRESDPGERMAAAERTPAERLALRPLEAAAALGLGRSTMYGLIASGEIPSFRVGTRAVRVPVEALREYVLARVKEGRQ